MGQLVYIKAKQKSIPNLNKVLKTMGIKNKFTTLKDNIWWLNDINTNPKSPQKHLKPSDRDLTMDELKQMFESYTTVGLLDFDIAFSRTTEELANKYLEFICICKSEIEYTRHALCMEEKYTVSPEQLQVLRALEQPEKELELLPEAEQYRPDLQSGLLLCKSWGLEPFWVVFGKTENDRPEFMKVRIYKDNDMNSLYRDKNGLAYLLIPLMPYNGSQVDFCTKVYVEAWSLGLREDYTYFIPMVYGINLTSDDEVSQQFREYYKPEEIEKRFFETFQKLSNDYGYNCSRGFVWGDIDRRFKAIGSDAPSNIRAKCTVLTALLLAMGSQWAARTMTDLTGKKYLAMEFYPRKK